MWTPPLTPAPGQTGSHSASSSVSGIPNAIGRRASERSESDRDEALSSSKKRELNTVQEGEEARENKKRRIAPTPIVMTTEGEDAVASTEDTPIAQASGQH